MWILGKLIIVNSVRAGTAATEGFEHRRRYFIVEIGRSLWTDREQGLFQYVRVAASAHNLQE